MIFATPGWGWAEVGFSCVVCNTGGALGVGFAGWVWFGWVWFGWAWSFRVLEITGVDMVNSSSGLLWGLETKATDFWVVDGSGGGGGGGDVVRLSIGDTWGVSNDLKGASSVGPMVKPPARLLFGRWMVDVEEEAVVVGGAVDWEWMFPGVVKGLMILGVVKGRMLGAVREGIFEVAVFFPGTRMPQDVSGDPATTDLFASDVVKEPNPMGESTMELKKPLCAARSWACVPTHGVSGAGGCGGCGGKGGS